MSNEPAVIKDEASRANHPFSVNLPKTMAKPMKTAVAQQQQQQQQPARSPVQIDATANFSPWDYLHNPVRGGDSPATLAPARLPACSSRSGGRGRTDALAHFIHSIALFAR